MGDTRLVDAASGSALVTTKVLFGRLMLPDQSEHPCNAVGVTAAGAEFSCAVPPGTGQTLIVYLEHLGRIECIAGEATENGFRVAFVQSGARLERFLSRLKWVCEQQAGETGNHRVYSRRPMADAHSRITLADGREYQCEVIDVSLTGAAIAMPVLPAIGSRVYLGKMLSEVVRHVDNGIALRFLTAFGSDLLGDIVENRPRGNAPLKSPPPQGG